MTSIKLRKTKRHQRAYALHEFQIGDFQENEEKTSWRKRVSCWNNSVIVVTAKEYNHNIMPLPQL